MVSLRKRAQQFSELRPKIVKVRGFSARKSPVMNYTRCWVFVMLVFCFTFYCWNNFPAIISINNFNSAIYSLFFSIQFCFNSTFSQLFIKNLNSANLLNSVIYFFYYIQFYFILSEIFLDLVFLEFRKSILIKA